MSTCIDLHTYMHVRYVAHVRLNAYMDKRAWFLLLRKGCISISYEHVLEEKCISLEARIKLHNFLNSKLIIDNM